MKCPKCNCEIADNAQFCHCCGVDLIHAKLKTQDDNNHYTSMMTAFVITILVLAGLLFIPVFSGIDEESMNVVIGFIEIILVILAILFCKKIKDVVLKVARWLLDFSTTIDVLTGIIILIIGITICKDGYINYWWFVLGAFIYTLIALVKDYALYLLVDIRDSLKILADKAKNEKGN